MTQTAKLDITRADERGLIIGLNEFSGYVGVALAGIVTGYAASMLGPREGLLVVRHRPSSGWRPCWRWSGVRGNAALGACRGRSGIAGCTRPGTEAALSAESVGASRRPARSSR